MNIVWSVCWLMVLASIVGKMFHFPGSGIMAMAGCSMLGIISIFQAIQQLILKGREAVVKMVRVGWYFSVSAFAIGFLFAIKSWPGREFNLQIALVALLVTLVAVLSWLLRNADTGSAETKKDLKNVATKSLLLAILISSLLLMSPSTLKLVLGGWKYTKEQKQLMVQCLDQGENCEAYHHAINPKPNDD